MKKLALSLLLTSLFSTFSNMALAQDKEVDGHWKGSISIAGTRLKIEVDVNTDDKGKATAILRIPEQTKQNLPLENFVRTDKKVHFDFPSPNGQATFEGNITKENTIEGEFSQNGFAGSFAIERKDSTEEVKQVKKVPLPYKEENVTFKNGDITIAGTLTLPENKKDFPTVIMITGSGPQNRDEEIFDFKIFGIIADHLTRNGIAVLRCDDRGVGESTGDFTKATSKDFATDIEAGINYLKTRKDINPKRIGLAGHSEGGIIAPMISARNTDVAFNVLIAGTGVNGEEIMLSQSAAISKANGMDEKKIELNQKLMMEGFNLVKTNAPEKDWNKLQDKIKEIIVDEIKRMSSEEKKTIKDEKAFIESNSKQQLVFFKSEWVKYFISYEPSTSLEKLKVPTLAIFGEKDLQVLPELNKSKMEQSFKKSGFKNYKIVVLPKANHLFQEANTGSPSEYIALKKEFIPEFLPLLSDWINKQ